MQGIVVLIYTLKGYLRTHTVPVFGSLRSLSLCQHRVARLQLSQWTTRLRASWQLTKTDKSLPFETHLINRSHLIGVNLALLASSYW